MPHQCTHCSTIFPDAAPELLTGCACGSKFFYYIRQAKYDEVKNQSRAVMAELTKADKKQIEKDIRELTGLDKEPETPVILDLESIKVLRPGKFEIDIVNLFSKNRPVIYKFGEGKYIIDLESSFKSKGVLSPSMRSELEGENDHEDSEEDDDDEDEEDEEDDDEVSDSEIDGGLEKETREVIIEEIDEDDEGDEDESEEDEIL